MSPKSDSVILTSTSPEQVVPYATLMGWEGLKAQIQVTMPSSASVPMYDKIKVKVSGEDPRDFPGSYSPNQVVDLKVPVQQWNTNYTFEVFVTWP